MGNDEENVHKLINIYFKFVYFCLLSLLDLKNDSPVKMVIKYDLNYCIIFFKNRDVNIRNKSNQHTCIRYKSTSSIRNILFLYICIHTSKTKIKKEESKINNTLCKRTNYHWRYVSLCDFCSVDCMSCCTYSCDVSLSLNKYTEKYCRVLKSYYYA